MFIPIAAYAMGSLFFGSNPNLVCGIVLEYSVPVAVTAFMWISMFGGNSARAHHHPDVLGYLACNDSSYAQAPAGRHRLDRRAEHDARHGLMIAIPAVLGIVINELTRGWGHEKLSPRFRRLQVHDDGCHRVQLHRHERLRAAHEC
ncbi:MAG: hypothetical protein ACLTYW_04550 [Collinsella sp.]